MRLAINGWFYDQPHTDSGNSRNGICDRLSVKESP